MAFFGVTNCGYQNPIRDRMLSKNTEGPGSVLALPPICPARRPSCSDTCTVYNQPQTLPYSSDLHRGSHLGYREMLKRHKTPRSPNQVYVMPMTDIQHYGWLLPNSDQWRRIRRFPRRHSEMTRFVMDMSMTNREFSLF
ncbi:sperm microtubule inner protein 11-like [Engraulis encrasicolus]|uniref:sperm microtubule inner protein 11-like n=1 Tax=Engraulis encrasicolus TaxID=184585 RepID=UPI002FCEE52A